MKKIALLFLALQTPMAFANRCNVNEVVQLLVGNKAENVQIIVTDLFKADRNLIQQIKAGKKFSYWVDANDTLRVSELHHTQPGDMLTLIKDRSTNEALIVKENGILTFDMDLKKPVFESKSNIDFYPGEVDSAIRSQLDSDFIRKADLRHNKARVIKCTEMMAAKEAGKNVIKDNLVTGTVVTIGSFMSVEYFDWKKKQKEKEEQEEFWKWQRFKLLPFDIVANMGTSAVGGFLEKFLVFKKNAGPLTTMIWEGGVDYANGKLIKAPIYKTKDKIFEHYNIKEEKKNKNMAEWLPLFDTGYSVIRFYPKMQFKRFLKNQYPEMLLSACINNPAASIIAGPRTLRILEKGMYGIGYFSLRKKIFPETDLIPSQSETEQNTGASAPSKTTIPTHLTTPSAAPTSTEERK